MKQFSCGAVVPGCDAKFEGDTVEEILAQVHEHATHDHGLQEVTPELVEQVQANIHDADTAA